MERSLIFLDCADGVTIIADDRLSVQLVTAYSFKAIRPPGPQSTN